MGSLCLSTALNLRCLSLSSIQSIALIIPTGLEVLFSFYLIVANWGSGRRHLLLAAEGWTYFALALIELLSRILPAVRANLRVFQGIDLTLGALSAIPLLLYTLFLFFFTVSETLDVVPRKFQRGGKVLLLLFIPFIVAADEISSFVGIRHRLVAFPGGKPFLAIDFINEDSHMVWTFFTSFSLALLTAYQAINFIFAFFRLAKAFINSRRIESSSTDEVQLFKGMGWINVGIKLGAIESVVGFANPGFETSLARRILRMLGRACLVVGVVKGPDFAEDFLILQDEMSKNNKKKGNNRRSLRPFISNPRFSTFRQMSPTATTFHAALNPNSEKPPGTPAMTTFAAVKDAVTRQRGQRVTVHFDETSGRAPTLEMRFSALNMPSPAVIAESVRSRPASEWISPTTGNPRRSSFYANSTVTSLGVPGEGGIVPLKRSQTLPSKHSANPSVTIRNAFANMSTSVSDTGHGHYRGPSDMSAYSQFSLSHSVVSDLAKQFPGLPPRVTKPRSQPQPQTWDDPYSNATREKETDSQPPRSGTLSASSSMKRKPVPVYVPIDPFNDVDDDPRSESEPQATLPTSLPAGHTPVPSLDRLAEIMGSPYSYRDGIAPPSGPTSTQVSPLSSGAWTQSRHRPSGSFGQASSTFTTPSTDTANPFKFDDSQSLRPSTLGEGGRIISLAPSEMILPLPSVAEVSGSSGTPSPIAFSPQPLPESGVLDGHHYQDEGQHNRGKSMETLDISWIKGHAPPIPLSARSIGDENYEGEVTLERAMKARQRSPSVTRIRGVGKAPRRYTPTAKTAAHTRGSVYIEPIVIPPRDKRSAQVEAVQGSIESAGPLRDSGVLGAEEEMYMQRRY